MTKPLAEDESRQKEVFAYFDTPQGERGETPEEIRKRLGMRLPMWKLYKERYEVYMVNKAGKTPKGYDSRQYLLDNLKAADQGLIDSCKKGNANSLRVLAQRLGLIVEKQETTLKLDGNDIARLALLVERGDGKEDTGMVEVQTQSDSLCNNLRVSSGQGTAEDN